MDVLYFAWLRERIGVPKEEIATGATTVADLVEELRSRSDAHALAFRLPVYARSRFSRR